MSTLYYESPKSDYLMHHGIKGQKWGVRRFQNEDGELTAAGRKRYEVEQRTSYSKGLKRQERVAMARRAIDPTMKGGKDKPPISPAEKIAKDTHKIAEDAGSLARQRNDRKARQRFVDEAKSMSDDDIKKAIARLQLEKQYKDLSMNVCDTGKHTIEDVIGTTATVVGIAASVAGIASTIHAIRKG